MTVWDILEIHYADQKLKFTCAPDTTQIQNTSYFLDLFIIFLFKPFMHFNFIHVNLMKLDKVTFLIFDTYSFRTVTESKKLN